MKLHLVRTTCFPEFSIQSNLVCFSEYKFTFPYHQYTNSWIIFYDCFEYHYLPVCQWPEGFQMLTQDLTFAITLFLMILRQNTCTLLYVGHGNVNCSCKQPYSKYFQLCELYGFCCKDLFLLSSQESSHR